MLHTIGILNKTVLKLQATNGFREGLPLVSDSGWSPPAGMKHQAHRPGPTVFSDTYLWVAAQAEEWDESYQKDVP